MISYYLIPSTRREANYDNPDGTLAITHGGIYYFLYPYLLQVKDQTGQMIDPQYTAEFTTDMFPVVLDKLKEARKAAETSPAQFAVHVGKQLTPVPKELYENVSRSELLGSIETLIAVFKEAADKKCRLLFFEY